MKAVGAIGVKKIYRFALGEIIRIMFSLCIVPPLRSLLLRFLGAKIGKDTIIHRFEFMNFYRGSFSQLTIGDSCYIGSGVLFDLADKIILEDNVTLSDRVVIVTHLNVGYKDHPLQKYFPATQGPVLIKKDSYMGVNVTILNSVEIGPQTFVAAGAVVNKTFEGHSVIGGIPAKVIKELP